MRDQRAAPSPCICTLFRSIGRSSADKHGFRSLTAVCFVDIPDGIPHVMHGVVAEFTVE